MGFYRDIYIERTQRDAVWRNFDANRNFNKFLSFNSIGTGEAVYGLLLLSNWAYAQKKSAVTISTFLSTDARPLHLVAAK